MRRNLFLSVFIYIILFCASAQQTVYYTNNDVSFNQGKELYSQRKYAASYRRFESFLKTVPPVQAGQVQEAEFYMAANAFYLHKKNAPQLLQNYLKNHPYTPFGDMTYFMLGQSELNAKKYSKAIDYYNKVTVERLGSYEKVDFLFGKGFANLQTKNYDVALPIFKRLKEMKTRYDLSATYYYAYTEYCLGNYKSALPEFLKIEDHPQYKNIVPYYIIQIYYAQKEYDKLNERAALLLKNNPDNTNNAEIYRIMGEIAYSKNDYTNAITNLKQYEKLSKQELRNDMYILGLSLYKTKNYKEAVKYLSKTTTDKDELTENAYLHIGNSYINVGDKNNARLAFEAALRTNFNSKVRMEALYNYALTTYETNSAFGESITAFEQFISEYPNSPNADKAQNYLATVFFTSKNYQTVYQSILKINKPNARILEAKQYVLYQLGTEAFTQVNNAKAIDLFTQSLQVQIASKYVAESLYWRSEAYYRLGQPEKSIDDLKDFFANTNSRTSVNLKAANYSMAYSFFSRKNYSQALSWFLKYTEMETNTKSTTYADALNRIGDCYFFERNFDKAEANYNKAIALSPNTGDYAMFQSAYMAGLQKNYNAKVSRIESLLRTYPRSEYADEALYEKGRAYIMLENDSKAIESFKALVGSHPTSVSARKGALELGLIYFNEGNFDEAIKAYKKVLLYYPGTEESYTALESLEAVYIEKNDVASFLAYTKTLGMKISSNTSNREDSISYIAAERQYMNEKFAQAITGFRSYLKSFCPGGRYCTTAQYYVADSYYRLGDKDNALVSYQSLLQVSGNQYAAEAATRCAEITYDKKDYTASLRYFKQMQQLAQTNDSRNVARLGVLRCSYFLNDHQTTISIASEMIGDSKTEANIKAEARYNRAKAYLATNKSADATADLKSLAADTRTVNGAEAKYLLANQYFEMKNYKDAETEVMDFAKKNTPHQYWLARSFVLLTDIYIDQKNDFQAKQYLLSLQKNYTEKDDIQTMITERLNAIVVRESQNTIN